MLLCNKFANPFCCRAPSSDRPTEGARCFTYCNFGLRIWRRQARESILEITSCGDIPERQW